MYSELASDQHDSQESLMKQLNTLLASLHLPNPLISPTDLTPRLLMAILESLMGIRLPITYHHELKDSKHTHAEKVEAMKIFLGVLETDFLQADVGLSHLDPRRLADGGWEEVLFIAKLLCWVGRRTASDDSMGVKHCSQPQSQAISNEQRLSPKSQLDLDAESLFQTSSTITTVAGNERLSQRTFSPFLKEQGGDSVTSVNTFEYRDEGSMSDASSDVHRTFTNPPRCIHEIPSPSLLFSVDQMRRTPSPDHNWSFCDCHPSIANTLPIEHDHPNTRFRIPVRTTGFIQPVDEEAELASFESNHRSSRQGRENSNTSNYLHSDSQKAARISALHEQYLRTVYLLNERARLLTQLADFKHS